MPIRTVVEPAVEPVSIELASLWCRAPDEDGALIELLVKAARERAENTTQRVFVQRTMEWSGSGFHAGSGQYYELPRWSEHSLAKLSMNYSAAGYGAVDLVAPAQSVVSVTYVDATGTTQTLDPAAYTLDAASEPGVLRYEPAFTLPIVKPNRADAVKVQFLAGYAPAGTGADIDYRANMPGALLAWMQIQVSTWYTQRENVETGGRLIETSRNFSEALLDGLIVASRFA